MYLIYRAGGLFSDPSLRYVGHSSSDVYKALYRHFQVWNDRQVRLGQRAERVTYERAGAYRVRVIYTRKGVEARELERALILKYQPPDNPDKLELYDITPAGRGMIKRAEGAAIVQDIEAPF